LPFSCLFTVHYGTDQRHLFFVSYYRLLDDSNVVLEESDQAAFVAAIERSLESEHEADQELKATVNNAMTSV
jgi:hypothetical protein